MYSLYRIVNKVSGRSYIGMTKNKLWYRFSGHKNAVRSGKKSPLYDAMRKYGVENFDIVLISEHCTKEDCSRSEVDAIASEDNLYNLASGGEGGFNVSNIEEWKEKLRTARKGRQPFLGRKHSEETKRKCAEASAARHARQRAENSELG